MTSPMSAFEKGWRVVKIGAYMLGGLFVLLLVIGWLARKDTPQRAPAPVAAAKSDTAPAPQSPAPKSVAPPSQPAAPAPAPEFIRQLEGAERNPGDLMKMLADGLKRSNDAEAQQVVDWLTPRRFRGELPYLYFLGAYLAKQYDSRKKQEGWEYLVKGGLIYRIDAGRCGDPTANQAVTIVESALGIGVLRTRLKESPILRKLLIAHAILYEGKTGPRPQPAWICAHGMSNFTGKRAPPDEQAFQAHRDAVTRQFVENY